jgi:hypothetical protein
MTTLLLAFRDFANAPKKYDDEITEITFFYFSNYLPLSRVVKIYFICRKCINGSVQTNLLTDYKNRNKHSMTAGVVKCLAIKMEK